MSKHETTRRDFMASLPIVMAGSDSGGWIDKDGDGDYLDDIFGEDEEASSGEYTIILGTREHFKETNAEENTAFQIFPGGTWYRAVEKDGSALGGQYEWEQVKSSGANPTFKNVEAESVITDEGKINNYLNAKQVRPTGRLGQHTTPIGGGRGNGTIAIETDDHRTGTYTEAYQDLKDRGLPWAIACYPPRVGEAPESVNWEELAQMYADGCEIALHPAGIDVLKDNEDEIYNFLIEQRNNLQDRGIYSQRVVFSSDPDFNNRSDWESFGGRLLLGAFNSVGNHGLEWYKGTNSTQNDLNQQMAANGGMWESRYLIGNKPQSQVLDVIDNVAESGGNLTIYWHPPNIGDSGSLSRSELQTILDDVATKRNNGNLNVVTPTAMKYLVGNARDNHVNPYPSFGKSDGLLYTGGTQPSKWAVTSSATTINTTTGRTGPNSLEIAPNEEAKYRWMHNSMTNCFVVEGYARTKASGTTANLQADIGIRANNDYPDMDSFFQPGQRVFSLNDTWTKFVTTAQTHYEFPAEQINLENRDDAEPILVDDVYIYPA
ncbi:polysaccharide deacetylase family protein [Haloarcula amylovorans]|uniref:hypothetical protein n=1 Tax=Haloarcula amylovorans TaxID=2562280 RepID=UPI0010766E45|nr:hypothetical protein [Halomicroarcula amylolytica]